MDVLTRGVGVRFADGTPALEAMDLSLQSAEQIALVGPSGSGKSTLLRVLSMALAPTQGQVQVNSRDPWQISAARRQSLRRSMHLCPQSSALPPRQRVAPAVLSALLPTRSALFGLRTLFSPAREDVALARERLSRLELEQYLWRPVESLSGGQRQRVAMARAMAADVDALFVDEPLSALDPANAEQALQALVDHARQEGQLLVCALHQIELAREQLQRVIGLRQGRLMFDCPASELSDAMIHELYRGREMELQA